MKVLVVLHTGQDSKHTISIEWTIFKALALKEICPEELSPLQQQALAHNNYIQFTGDGIVLLPRIYWQAGVKEVVEEPALPTEAAARYEVWSPALVPALNF